MAGVGSRLANAGFNGPKWAIRPPWTDRSLLNLSIKGICESIPGSDLLLITLGGTYDSEILRNALGPTLKPLGVVELGQLQRGPLASIAAAWDELGLGGYAELWFTTCDTYVPAINYEAAPSAKGTVVCFNFDAPNLCHVDVGDQAQVFRLREKVGNLAPLSSTGTFRINCVEEFRRAMLDVLASPSVRGSGEYFISDAINALLRQGLGFDAVVVPGAWALGTSEDLTNCPPAIAWAMR